MKFFPPKGNFSDHKGSMECKGLITAEKSTLEFKTGPIEVEIMTNSRKSVRWSAVPVAPTVSGQTGIGINLYGS